MGENVVSTGSTTRGKGATHRETTRGTTRETTRETARESAVRFDQDGEGIVVLTLDDPTSSANTMNELYLASMGAALDRLEAQRDRVTGVVVTSAKKTFFAGGDLKRMAQAGPEDAA